MPGISSLLSTSWLGRELKPMQRVTAVLIIVSVQLAACVWAICVPFGRRRHSGGVGLLLLACPVAWV